MKNHWIQWSQKFAALTLRERLIVLFAVIALIVFGWLHFVFDPVTRAKKQIQGQLLSLDESIVSSAEELSLLQQQLANDPNQVLLAQQRQLDATLQQLNADIDARLKGLLGPERMLDTLREIVATQKGATQKPVQLVSVRNLPAEPYELVGKKKPPSDATADSTEESQAGAEQAAIYSHQMEVVLEGSYFEVASYLQLLEAQPGLYLQSFSYEVLDYPLARVVMRLSTLSLEEAWIGV